MAATAKAAKIMLIRHAEKPVQDPAPVGSLEGVDLNGTQDKHSLIVQGWQRAGALTCLFASTHGPLQNPGLATPQFLYAAAPGGQADSDRPYQTILPLSQKLQMKIHKHFTKTQTTQLVAEVEARNGVVLIAWEHAHIPVIANQILGNTTTAPQTWPHDRFDVVWVFDWNSTSGTYAFSQIPQCLLAGDLPTPIQQ